MKIFSIKLHCKDIKMIANFLDYGTGNIDDILMEICAQARQQKDTQKGGRKNEKTSI